MKRGSQLKQTKEWIQSLADESWLQLFQFENEGLFQTHKQIVFIDF